MTVYGYVRVSTAEQAADDRTSLATQRVRISQAAAAAGLAVDQFIEEIGVSGGKRLADLPQGSALLDCLGKDDTVIIAKLDRGFRNAADALAVAEQLKQRRVDLIVADMGSEPVTQNGVSRMFFGMLALVAEFERARLHERTADGRNAKRRNGGHLGGDAPFGFRKVGAGRTARLERIDDQQDALARMMAMRAEGKSLRAISAELATMGHKLSHVAVRAALTRSEQDKFWREACNEARDATLATYGKTWPDLVGAMSVERETRAARRQLSEALGYTPPPHPLDI